MTQETENFKFERLRTEIKMGLDQIENGEAVDQGHSIHFYKMFI